MLSWPLLPSSSCWALPRAECVTVCSSHVPFWCTKSRWPTAYEWTLSPPRFVSWSITNASTVSCRVPSENTFSRLLRSWATVSLDEAGRGFAAYSLITLVAQYFERGHGLQEGLKCWNSRQEVLSSCLKYHTHGCRTWRLPRQHGLVDLVKRERELFVRDEVLRRWLFVCTCEEQSPLPQPTVQSSSRVDDCNRLPSHESQLLLRQYLICGHWQRQGRLAQQRCQRLCQLLNSVPSHLFLPRAAIAVAKSAQRALEQWKEEMDGVKVLLNGFSIALLASAAVRNELRRHLQHASTQLQRELGVGRPVCWRLAFAHLPEL
eukprot:scaffold82349_cov62-Phaeocystis_antarctica.AAC.2